MSEAEPNNQPVTAKPSTPLTEHPQRPPSRTLGSRVSTPSQIRRGTPSSTQHAVEDDMSLLPVESEVVEEMTWEERCEMLQQSLENRKASRIQQQWRNFKLAKAEAKHIRTIQRLSKLNESALLIQQWWRILLAKKAAGITALFKTHQVNKLRTEPVHVRRKKAADYVWQRQEAALRELSAVDTRRFWQETNFFTQSKKLLSSVRDMQRSQSQHQVEEIVPYKGEWVSRKVAARRKEQALEDFQTLKRRKAYNKKINPEKLQGRYEMRVSAASPQPLKPLPRKRRDAGERPRPASLLPLPASRKIQQPDVSEQQWNPSPWMGDAPWAAEPKHYRKRTLRSSLD